MLRKRRPVLNGILLTLTLLTGSANAAKVNWTEDIEGALQQANQSGQLVLLKFTADWCGYCKKMERETFTQPAVAEVVNTGFVPVLVDADKHKDLVKHLKIRGLPAILIVSPEMVILDRISGYQTEAKLLPRINAVIAQHGGGQKSPAAIADGNDRPVTATVPVSQQTVAPPAATVETTGPAFGGLCLPAVKETRSLVSGRPEFTMTYRGKTLQFSSPDQMARFRTEPEKYWPQLDGQCPVALLETNRPVEGKLEYAAMFRGQLWVMESPEAMKRFVAEPARYADALKTRTATGPQPVNGSSQN